MSSQNLSKAPEENKFSNHFVSSLFICPPTDLSEKPLQKRPTTRCLIFGQKNFPNKVSLATVKEFENIIHDNSMKLWGSCHFHDALKCIKLRIKCTNILESDQKATNYCTHLHCLYTMLPDTKPANADKGSNATKTSWNWTAILKVWLHHTLETDIIISKLQFSFNSFWLHLNLYQHISFVPCLPKLALTFRQPMIVIAEA